MKQPTREEVATQFALDPVRKEYFEKGAAWENKRMREAILGIILGYLNSSDSYASAKGFERALTYRVAAEALIEVLEVEDCGSCGGYDKENPLVDTTNDRHRNRYLTLLNKGIEK